MLAIVSVPASRNAGVSPLRRKSAPPVEMTTLGGWGDGAEKHLRGAAIQPLCSSPSRLLEGQ